MKKTFLATRNTLLSSASISWGTGALTVALLALLLRLLTPNIFWYAFTPLFHVSDALASESHTFFSSFSNTAALANQNERLTDENAALRGENQSLLKKMDELSGLKANSVIGVVAGVVARPPESPYDTLVLAAGSEEGVALGQEAFGAGDVPLGVVSSVLAHFSRVTLFSAPGMTTHGWVGHAGTALTIIGEGAGALQASAPRSAGILAGDTVFVPGPGMLRVGTVVRIDGNASSISVTLRIQPALNLFSVTEVLLRDSGAALFVSLPSATSTPL